MTKIDLHLASSNLNKLKEIKALLIDLDINVIAAPIGFSTPEEENSYLENAKEKASTLATQYNVLALADDSGLEVQALNGKPGLKSARYLAQHGLDGLLTELGGNQPNRKAQFICALSLCDPTGAEIWSTEQRLDGIITSEARGMAGFGFDPIFAPTALGLTMAELSTEEKNRISHRAQALTQFRVYLESRPRALYSD